MTIVQHHIDINKPVAEVYTFLSDLNNHEQLMPENIYNWSSTADEARFTIKNMAKLALGVTKRDENKEIVCTPIEEVPFAVTLRWQVEEKAPDVTKATFVIEADLNMMMKMIAGGPLKKLVDHQVNALKQLLG